MLASPSVRRSGALLAVATAALVGVSACGSSSSRGAGSTTSLSPADAAKKGFEGLYDGKALTATVKVDMTASDLVAFSKASGDDKPITSTQASVLSGGTFVLALKAAGSSFADDAKNKASGQQVALTVNGTGAADLFQLVYDTKAIYARADLAKLASLAGSDTSSLSTLAANAPAQYKTVIEDALAGKWLKVDAAQLKALAKQASPSGVPSTNPGQASALVQALGGIYGKDVTVTRGAADATLGDHLVLTGNARTIGSDLASAFKTELSGVPGIAQAFGSADPSKIADKDVTVDEYVKDGKVTELKLDLTQLFTSAEKAAVKGPAAIVITMSDSADVSAPASSTPVDISQFGGLLGGAGGGL